MSGLAALSRDGPPPLQMGHIHGVHAPYHRGRDLSFPRDPFLPEVPCLQGLPEINPRIDRISSYISDNFRRHSRAARASG